MFAAATSLFTVEPRSLVPCTDRDVFMLVRGLVKLMRRDDASPPRIYEFHEAPAMLAPRTKPSWAVRNLPPISGQRWGATRWELTNTDLVTVERSTFLRLDFRVIEKLMSRHAAWGEASSALMWSYVEGLFASVEFTRSRTMDVEARVRYLQEHRGDLLRRVSQREIAAYLNITESALSRVMRRLRARDVEAARRLGVEAASVGERDATFVGDVDTDRLPEADAG